jgi:hypothetical protein
MKLPSLQRLAEQALAVARRFPLVLVCGVISAVAGSLMVGSGDNEEVYLRILYASSLGLPLFVGLELLAQRHGWKGLGKLVALAAGVAFLVLIYVLRPGWSDSVALTRYFQLWVGLHLFVAVGPYLGVEEKNGFWQYNMTLFLRFLLAGVFAAVLYFGLSIALLAVENLFGLDVDGEWYGRLWFMLAFVFQPWVFLGGVPEDLPALEARTTYPHGLKVFAQYVLAPIVALYLVILTLYLGKILLTQEWPSGWIGWLVSCVAAAGILSLLLLHPVEEQEEDRWVQTYARGFYVALIPSIAMLLMAIWKRIEQYGVTERRYLLVILSLWLAGIAVFFIVRRRGSIKVIPATLGLLAFLTIGGPWGAYAVSERSQVARLEGVLDRNGMLSDGRVQPPAEEVSYEDRREVSAVIRYLTETHGVDAIEPWFENGLASIDTISSETDGSRGGDADARAGVIVSAMGLDYVDRWAGVTDSGFHFSTGSDESPIYISGHEYVLRDRFAGSETFVVDGRELEFAWDDESAVLTLLAEADTLVAVSLLPAVESAIGYRSDSSGTGSIPTYVLMSEARTERAWMSVYLGSISGTRAADPGDEVPGEDAVQVDNWHGDIFFTLFPPAEDTSEVIE